jgi:hypothetical protein
VSARATRVWFPAALALASFGTTGAQLYVLLHADPAPTTQRQDDDGPLDDLVALGAEAARAAQSARASQDPAQVQAASEALRAFIVAAARWSRAHRTPDHDETHPACLECGVLDEVTGEVVAACCCG